MKLDSAEGSECRNVALVCLVIHLEENLDGPVVDETGLSGRYDWDAQWPRNAPPEAIADAVRSQLGLAIAPARRPMEMLILERPQ